MIAHTLTYMEATNTTAATARRELAKAHDRAIGFTPEFGTPEHVAYSARCALVFDFWSIASEAAYQLGLA